MNVNQIILLEQNNMDLSMDNEYIFSQSDYERGLQVLSECYEECMAIEQKGGITEGEHEIDTATALRILQNIFSPDMIRPITRVCRGILRTGTGLSADILSAGAGGDIVPNSVFAIEGHLSFLAAIKKLGLSLKQIHTLFDQLFELDFSKKIPIISKLNLDNGLQMFESKFDTILLEHINKYDKKMLDKVYQSMLDIIDKITTTVSDWVACLFPDTAGLAGEITKTVLDYITKHGFTYTYNLISFLPENLQKMITNDIALKKLIWNAVVCLRKILINVTPNQMVQIVSVIGVKASGSISNPLLKKTISTGTAIASTGLKTMVPRINLESLKYARKVIIFVIDHYVFPNIGNGVDLFNQLLPLFLMFTLFIEKYKAITEGKFTVQNIKPNPISNILALSPQLEEK